MEEMSGTQNKQRHITELATSIRPDFDLEEELKKLPDSPGVYLMHGEKDEIIYVGKAIVLKNRVRQYFQDSRGKSAKIRKMVSHITRFEYIITDSELEALVLECNLIKEHQPRYNTMLKDGKTYPYICVTLSEDYPRVFQTRQRRNSGGKDLYFGPFTSLGELKQVLELIHKFYQIRSCKKNITKDSIPDRTERPCLNYDVKQCKAPCMGLITQEDYRAQVNRVVSLLNGHCEEVVRELTEQMSAASEEMDYESAIRLRDLIESVKYVAGAKQRITDTKEQPDRDVMAVAIDGKDAVASVFFVRDGKMIGREHVHLTVGEGDDRRQIITSLLKQFYAGTPLIPREIFIQEEIDADEQAEIEGWLSSVRGGPVHIIVPKIGRKEKTVELALKNAELILHQDMEKIRREESRTLGAMADLSAALGLNGASRVEAYDISNTSGVLSVGSMVVFEDGRPKKNAYRKFRIRTVEGPDDYASMREVLTRRFTENENFGRFPDLVMMDGGKGQVHIAEEVMQRLGLSIPICGMVKDDHHRTRGLYWQDEEIPIDTHGEMFAMITRVQDEAHRFAIEYHKSLRSKESIHSILDDIDGIGPKRRLALMKNFGDIDRIRAASLEELSDAEGMNRLAALAVYQFFHGSTEEDARNS